MHERYWSSRVFVFWIDLSCQVFRTRRRITQKEARQKSERQVRSRWGGDGEQANRALCVLSCAHHGVQISRIWFSVFFKPSRILRKNRALSNFPFLHATLRPRVFHTPGPHSFHRPLESALTLSTQSSRVRGTYGQRTIRKIGTARSLPTE